MIVLFCSNSKGGIVQFTIKMLETLLNIGQEVIAFLPEETKLSYNSRVIRYHRKSTINGLNASIRTISNEILGYHPDLVLFTDETLSSSQVLNLISKNVNVAMCVHDVVPHAYNKWFYYRLKKALAKPQIEHAYKKAKHIVLLSYNSKKIFEDLYKKYKNKTVYLRLGAHVPSVISKMPEELKGLDGYILFFGRIDRYKGIENLLLAYSGIVDEITSDLVIAGNGDFTNKEKELLHSLDRVKIINRYIDDSEMLWIFEHSKVVVLPYIEASQSGVLPIAYHYNKPVVVSNLPGLTENVFEDKTGFIYYDEADFERKLLRAINHSEAMKADIMSYYEKYFCWEQNIKECLENLI